MLSNLLHKLQQTCSKKIKLFSYGFLLLLFLSLVFLFSISLPIETEATTTYYQNNEMYLTGTLHYVGTSTGYSPVDNFDGDTVTIYLNGESERCLSIDPYLSNMCNVSVEGWLNTGYECSIPYSDRLHVIQPVYDRNNTQRSGTVYYDVEVQDIQTNLLYRPQRNENYITLIVVGIILFSVFSLIKGIRYD